MSISIEVAYTKDIGFGSIAIVFEVTEDDGENEKYYYQVKGVSPKGMIDINIQHAMKALVEYAMDSGVEIEPSLFREGFFTYRPLDKESAYWTTNIDHAERYFEEHQY